MAVTVSLASPPGAAVFGAASTGATSAGTTPVAVSATVVDGGISASAVPLDAAALDAVPLAAVIEAVGAAGSVFEQPTRVPAVAMAIRTDACRIQRCLMGAMVDRNVRWGPH